MHRHSVETLLQHARQNTGKTGKVNVYGAFVGFQAPHNGGLRFKILNGRVRRILLSWIYRRHNSRPPTLHVGLMFESVTIQRGATRLSRRGALRLITVLQLFR